MNKVRKYQRQQKKNRGGKETLQNTGLDLRTSQKRTFSLHLPGEGHFLKGFIWNDSGWLFQIHGSRKYKRSSRCCTYVYQPATTLQSRWYYFHLTVENSNKEASDLPKARQIKGMAGHIYR